MPELVRAAYKVTRLQGRGAGKHGMGYTVGLHGCTVGVHGKVGVTRLQGRAYKVGVTRLLGYVPHASPLGRCVMLSRFMLYLERKQNVSGNTFYAGFETFVGWDPPDT